jgi:transcriptional regulator with XRE-family HTH domain
MGEARQTFERRRLGLALRRLREQASVSQQEAAERIDKARPRMVELEDGRGVISIADLESLLDLYGVAADERAAVLEVGVQARQRPKRRSTSHLPPGEYQRFADMESNAREADYYEFGLVPGMLQAPGYMRFLFEDANGAWWDASSTEMEERIAFRIGRQKRVMESAEPPRMRFVFTDQVLLEGFDAAVLREQRRHILSLVTRHENLTVQVLPAAKPGNPARGVGFALFRFGTGAPPVAFPSAAYGPSPYYDEEKVTSTMLRVFERLRELALAPEESVRFIRAIDDR